MTAPAHPSASVSAGLDRSGAERADPDLVAHLRAESATRVLVVHGDRAEVATGDRPRLRWSRPDLVPHGAHWAFLGRASDGAALLAAVLPADTPAPEPRPDRVALRTAGVLLDAGEAEAFVTAVALGRWLAGAAFCPTCGGETTVHAAGWSRVCRRCGREIFPRTDPAVIVAVESARAPYRLLLGSNALWEAHRFSCFAGFVEAGESAESAVVRELAEESGVAVVDVRYRGSQSWPYPRSLMLGFRARAVDERAARADGDEIAELRWFTRDEIGAALAAGEGGADSGFLLPGPASIAHRLIADWYRETA